MAVDATCGSGSNASSSDVRGYGSSDGTLAVLTLLPVDDACVGSGRSCLVFGADLVCTVSAGYLAGVGVRSPAVLGDFEAVVAALSVLTVDLSVSTVGTTG